MNQTNALDIGIDRNKWSALKSTEATTEQALEIMTKHRFDVIPIDDNDSSPVLEYHYTKTYNKWSKETVSQATIHYDDVLPAYTSINELIQKFTETERTFFFLNEDDRIIGLVTLSDINTKKVRVWLYSLFNEFETRLSHLTKAYLSDEIILDIAKDEVKNAYKEDLNNGYDSNITEYLYLTDLLTIIKKKELYKRIDYNSKTQFAKLNSLNELRNNVMHPIRSLINNNNPVKKLCSEIEMLNDALFRLRQNQY